MNHFKNHFLMLLVITFTVCDVKMTHTEDEEETSSVNTLEHEQQSKSLIDRFKESEFNRRASERVNNFKRNVNDFFFKKHEPKTIRPELSKPFNSEPTFGEDPNEVRYRAADKLEGEDNWDKTTEEDGNIRLTDFEEKFGKRRSSWKNIFKSDNDLLEKYLQNPSVREERVQEPEVRIALAKLSRTNIADLFTKITQQEISEFKTKNSNLSPDQIEELYIKTFNKNELLFKKILQDSDPAGKKQYILIPSRPAEITANSLVNFKFEILDMSEYDSNLTIAENAERMKEAQNLSIRANRFSPESPTNDLATYIKNYLEDNPNTKNLKALLVNDFTTLDITTNVSDAQAELAKILDPSEKMKRLFRNLTADQLTDITKAQIKAQERNMNFTDKGAKVSHVEAQRIFKQNAEVYQRFTKVDNLIIPTEDASRSNQNSLKFEIIDLSSIKTELANLDYKNVDLEILDSNKSRTFYSQKNIKATDAMNKIIQKIRTEQPEIQLSDVELAKELIHYLRHNKIELPKQQMSPTEALTKLAEEKVGAENVNKIIMNIRKASENPYSEQTTREVNQALQKLIHPRQ